ncbi:MAG: hypothetical protein WCO51_08505 [bacterium]
MAKIFYLFVCLVIILTSALAQQSKPAIKRPCEYKRLVRIYSLGDKPAKGNLYDTNRKTGQRLFLSTEASGTIDLEPLAALGITLFQSETDPLGTPEIAEGNWNWKPYNAQRQLAFGVGADWGLFLHASFPPEWYCNKNGFTHLTCLQHEKTVQAFSPWSDGFAKFIDRNWAAARIRYSEIPAIVLGIHGDYGDAGLMTGLRMLSSDQKADWEKRFGDDHNHVDFWCGDEAARESFTKNMLSLYGSLDGINEAWKTSFKTIKDLEFPTNTKMSYQARLDFANWYKNGVTSMADTFARIARRYYPNSLMMIPIGDTDESIKLGYDVSALVKIATRYNAAIRCTNSGFQPLDINHSASLSHIRAACRFYNVPLWMASASPSNEAGFNQRLFEALSTGAVGYYDWSKNWNDHMKLAERLSKHLKRAEPKVDIVCLFPSSTHDVRPNESYPPIMLNGMRELRDITDFDVADERMVQDGALADYRVAVMWEGTIWKKASLEKIQEWVKSGGILVAYDFGKLQTPDGDVSLFNSLFGYTKNLPAYRPSANFVPSQDWAHTMESGWTVYFPAQKKEMASYIELVRAVALGNYPAGNKKGSISQADDEKDGVYTTVCTDRVLYFNTTDSPVNRTLQIASNQEEKKITIEPHSFGVIYLNDEPQELLLQCEKFTDMNRQKTITSAVCSPGSGNTAVSVSAGKSILTRVPVSSEGTYRIFGRALVKDKLTRVQLKVDGTIMTGSAHPSRADVIDYGTISLTKGVHTFELTNPQSFQADFLLATNDPTVSGYRFPYLGK